jgi:hypothetical protein
MSKTPITQKKCWWMAQGEGPEFKFQYCKKKKIVNCRGISFASYTLVPRYVEILTLVPVEMTLFGNEVFADVIKLR